MKRGNSTRASGALSSHTVSSIAKEVFAEIASGDRDGDSGLRRIEAAVRRKRGTNQDVDRVRASVAGGLEAFRDAETMYRHFITWEQLHELTLDLVATIHKYMVQGPGDAEVVDAAKRLADSCLETAGALQSKMPAVLSVEDSTYREMAIAALNRRGHSLEHAAWAVGILYRGTPADGRTGKRAVSRRAVSRRLATIDRKKDELDRLAAGLDARLKRARDQ